ncbi:MAG TPA: helix-turn-helix transcriptional regulator [Pyrinomonadaceae bacterium]|nr:helix-turn-helix transcriptional regulator [Pyrinomonadaceae bacterium]
MGTRSRPKPKHLARKLKQIRLSLGLSQDGLIDRLGVEEEVVRSTISAFERGVREPSYPLLLKYARIAGVSTDALIDDDAELDLS